MFTHTRHLTVHPDPPLKSVASVCRTPHRRCLQYSPISNSHSSFLSPILLKPPSNLRPSDTLAISFILSFPTHPLLFNSHYASSRPVSQHSVKRHCTTYNQLQHDPCVGPYPAPSSRRMARCRLRPPRGRAAPYSIRTRR